MGVGGRRRASGGSSAAASRATAGRPIDSGPVDLRRLHDFRTDLQDTGGFGHTAFRSVSVACVRDASTRAWRIDQDDDSSTCLTSRLHVLDNGVTVAAWVNPTKLNGVRTIFRKRESGTSTFVLLTNGKNYQFVIRLANGRAAAVSAPAPLDKFTHVAATYDGSDLRLYFNGVQVTHTRVGGLLSNGAGPLLMGNDALNRRTDGTHGQRLLRDPRAERRRDRSPGLHPSSVDAGRHPAVERAGARREPR